MTWIIDRLDDQKDTTLEQLFGDHPAQIRSILRTAREHHKQCGLDQDHHDDK